ncbi:hypothetical protein AWR36_010500 [Microbulbifer flavimaris]|uniref:GIY-YIG domain-containing protein n=2 Tax=Microbulbiferaceae TaxID=1706373 RepID=A0ABX4I028_9GAMM|nr:hypothetical protein AVO43_10480 [Microbulbifer sp. ZGT114]PCO05148.1 hypothetical protein AWR36_010500 [Microbulbifer flavimaris]
MSRFNKEYSALKVEQLRLLRGHNYIALTRGFKKIPTCSGIYIWRYWPTVRGLEFDSLINLFKRIQCEFPQHVEKLKSTRIQATIVRTPFAGEDDERIFGKIRDHNKILTLLNTLEKSKENRIALATLIECLLGQAPPVYIGKANNLQKRLLQHFEGKTDFSGRLAKTSIPLEDIYISYIKDEISLSDESITTTMEEILQKITNPPLVSRYG